MGEPLTVSLRLRYNGGAGPAVGAQWTSALPANLQYLGGAGLRFEGGVVSGTVQRLTPLTDTLFVFQASPSAAGTFRLAAQIAAATAPDANSLPNSGTAAGEDDAATTDFRVGENGTPLFESPNPNQRTLPGTLSNQPPPSATQTDLSLRIALNSRDAGPNELIDCTIQVSNAGGATATGVQVQNQLPDGLQFVGGAGWTAAGNLLTTTLPDLVGGTSVRLSFQARVVTTGYWINQAQISACTPTDVDSTPGNGFANGEDDTAQADIRVR